MKRNRVSFAAFVTLASLLGWVFSQANALSEASQKETSNNSACFYTNPDGEVTNLVELCGHPADMSRDEIEAAIDLAMDDFAEWQKQELRAEGVPIPSG